MATDRIPLAGYNEQTRRSRQTLTLWTRLLAWLMEPMPAEDHPLAHLTPRDWADLPVHHPERDD